MRFNMYLVIFSGFSFFLAAPPSVQGGEVLSCKYFAKKAQTRCLIKNILDDDAFVGDQVVLYNSQLYWVATGKVTRKKGTLAVGVFENSSYVVRKGLSAVYERPLEEGVLDWNLSFREKTKFVD